MWKHLTAIGALAAAVSAAPAFAQQSPSDQTQPPAATEPQQPDQGAAMDELVGLEVWSSDGQKLGEVTKVNQSADGKVESIHVDIGAFLGIGGKTVEVSSGEYTQTGDRIELPVTAENADSLPEAKAE